MAELLARGYITISAVNDGYNPLLTASSVSIPANHDGSKHDLTHAKTLVSLYKGESKVPMFISSIVASVSGITYSQKVIDQYTCEISITKIASSITSGYLEVTVGTSSGYKTAVRFGFSVLKNTSSLDWIEEWNGTKTQIGENYVVTPKLFAGHKSPDGKITGVYLGKIKGFLGETSIPGQADQDEGIYGYRDNKLVFYLNGKDAKIGGWTINHAGIQCEDGTMTILSEGTISSQHNGITNWILRKDGSASFANGKVSMDANGNASFDGTIKSSSGQIGGWNIVKDSIYIGTQNNKAGQFTSDIYSITIGTQGIRGYKFRFEKTGAGSIAGDNISWDDNGNVTFSKNVSLAWQKDIDSLTNRVTKIDAQGIYTGSIDASQITAGYIKADRLDAKSIQSEIINTQYISGLACTFEKGSIGKWIITPDSIKKDNVTLGANGDISCVINSSTLWMIDHLGNALFGNGRVAFNANGSGKVANGNISWDDNGNIVFSNSVKKVWEEKIGIVQQNLDTQVEILNGKIGSTITSEVIDLEREKQNILSACNDSNMMSEDPSFRKGTGGISVYNNGNSNAVTIERKTGCLVNKSGYYLEVKTAATGDTTPGYGGFTFHYQTSAQKRLVVIFSAILDTGRIFSFATNPTGNASRHMWLTSNKGKGTWATYAFYVECGKTGTFNSTFYFFVEGGSRPVSTLISYAAIHQLDADLDFKARLSKTESQIVQQADLIATKVSVETFNKLGNRVSNAESTLTQQAGLIATKVSKTDFDGLGNRVSNAETSIKQTTELISQKVSKTEFNTITGEVSTLKTTIKQQADQIALKISKSDAQDMDNKLNETIKASFVMTSNGFQLFGKEFSLTGRVTFSSLDSATQNKINQASKDAASAASDASAASNDAYYAAQDAASAASDASAASKDAASALNAANTANSNANSALNAANTANQNANTANQEALKAQQIANAKLDKTTIIEGGFIKTSLIDVDNIFTHTINAKNFNLKTGSIGPFVVTETDLKSTTNNQNNILSLNADNIAFKDSTGWNTREAIIGGNVTRQLANGNSYKCAGYFNGGGDVGIYCYGMTSLVARGGDVFITPDSVSNTEIHGLVLNSRNVSYSCTLNNNDDIVIISGSSNISITMPNAREGKIMFLKKLGRNNVNLVGATFMQPDGNSTSSQNLSNYPAIAICTAYKQWVLMW